MPSIKPIGVIIILFSIIGCGRNKAASLRPVSLLLIALNNEISFIKVIFSISITNQSAKPTLDKITFIIQNYNDRLFFKEENLIFNFYNEINKKSGFITFSTYQDFNERFNAIDKKAQADIETEVPLLIKALIDYQESVLSESELNQALSEFITVIDPKENNYLNLIDLLIKASSLGSSLNNFYSIEA